MFSEFIPWGQINEEFLQVSKKKRGQLKANLKSIVVDNARKLVQEKR